MANFLVRIELHDEQPNDYPRLHAEMEARGFSRQISLMRGGMHHLPHATYLIDSSFNKTQIWQLADAARIAIGRQAGIVVAQAVDEGITTSGLRPVN